MPFIDPLPADANPEVAELAKFFNETLGFCPNSVLTMSRRPEIAKAFIQLNMAVMANHGRVSSALKRLIAYVSSHATGCLYCQAHTIRAADRYGAAPEQLAHIWEFRTHAAFSAAERAALELASAASMVPNDVSAELQAEVKRHWDDGEVVEIMGVIALFGFLNRWNDSMATSLEEGAIASGEALLTAGSEWQVGKHQ
ncbi:MAG: peroxidase [Ideonella sp. MAG2]|nr:MAG: peroxidase [Ideonella sp. MAG2]